jgi:predicted phosphodiesterase
MRATWLTDLHLNFIKVPRMMKLCDELRAEKPDVLFVTGDTGEADNVFQHLEQLRMALKVPLYYVLGNHDFYGADIETVREVARERAHTGEWAKWLPALDPIRLTDHVVLVGVDGWGDAGCGDPEGFKVKLNDWKYIQDLHAVYHLGSTIRLETLRVLGRQEAEALRTKLAKVGPCKKLVVLTHVPPFPEACVYGGKMSDRDWLPWFTCVEVGKVLAEYAGSTEAEILVLCGHTHGAGIYQQNFNLEVRTGGWPVGVKDYGNPIVQGTIVL